MPRETGAGSIWATDNGRRCRRYIYGIPHYEEFGLQLPGRHYRAAAVRLPTAVRRRAWRKGYVPTTGPVRLIAGVVRTMPVARLWLGIVALFSTAPSHWRTPSLAG